MKHKVAYRFRPVLFALIMSCSTALIVSCIILYLHTESHQHFMVNWLSAFITAWPIVFIAILLIAPMVNKLLDTFMERNTNQKPLNLKE